MLLAYIQFFGVCATLPPTPSYRHWFLSRDSRVFIGLSDQPLFDLQ
jgi:hypothetical protein